MIRPVQRSIPALVLSFTAAVALVAQGRAGNVLAQARSAMFGKTAATQLAVTATVKRKVQSIGAEMTSQVELELGLPDRYRRTEHISVGGMTRVVSMGLNGDTFSYDDGGAAAAAGMNPNAPGPAHDEAVKKAKQDRFLWLTIGLLTPSASPGLTVASAGAEQGQEAKGDAVDVKGPEGLNLRLFFDTTSHRLLLATYQVESIDAEQSRLLQQKIIQQVQSGQIDPKNAGQVMQAEMAKLPKKLISVRMRFSEPKTMGGVTLPTRIETEGGPQGPEEWTISGIDLNAQRVGA